MKRIALVATFAVASTAGFASRAGVASADDPDDQATQPTAAAAVPEPPEPLPPPPPTPFDRGRFSLGLGGGEQSIGANKYIVIGGGVGYYLVNGVSIGVSAQHYFAENDGPTINIVTPSLTYVARPLFGKAPVLPYVGAFYDHYFISDFPDLDGIGARAGVMFVQGHIVLSVGVRVERTLSTCAENCTNISPDIGVGLSI